MWDCLWHGMTLATCHSKEKGFGLIKNAALAVQDGRIVWIGEVSTLPENHAHLAREIIQLEGKLMTPGLIDCHTHLAFSGNRAHEFYQRLHGVTYQEIAKSGGGILSTVHATCEADEDTLYRETAKRLEAMIAQGVTSIEIKSGYGLTTETELKQLRVIQRLATSFPVTIYPTFLALHAIPPQYKNEPDKYLTYVCEETLPKVVAANLATAVDAFCEHIAFTPQQIERLFSKAEDYGLKIKLHAEQLSDTGGALLAARFHALSADHLEYATEAGIAALAGAGTTAVLLPGAFYFLREKTKPPVSLLREYDVPIALATDCNPGTSPTTALPMMMNMAAVLWYLTPEEALRGVTINAAKALGIADTYGSLEINKVADFVIWPLSHPEELVYLMNPPAPHSVIKQGKIIRV